MSEFKELIRRFDKIRGYVREFYLYGFKNRDDYQEKSSRTYDNERRRLESWFSGYIRSNHKGHKKSVFITMDSSRIAVNPLYQAWKSKTFTNRDITLHFLLPWLLFHQPFHSEEELTDQLQIQFGVLEDTQAVRRKLSEYEQEGIFCKKKQGKQYLFSLASDLRSHVPQLFPSLYHAVCYFQGTAPFGFVGSTIMDLWNLENPYFRFRNDYLIHTLEDEILLPLLRAIQEQRRLCLTVKSTKSGKSQEFVAVPLKILVSTQTGRRYVCVRRLDSRRLTSVRLDTICDVEFQDLEPEFTSCQKALSSNLSYVWGVSFGNSRQPETVRMCIQLNEQSELHILNRLEREGRLGAIKRQQPGLYEYTCSCWDASEMLPWVKSFIGRIVSFTCSNPEVEKRFWNDIRLMKQMYQA